MKEKKTAFVLGGGGSRGAYEIGVWQALLELGIEVDMVMGTSVGSINSAMIAQNDFELAQKLWKQLETSMIFDVDTQDQQHPIPQLNLDIGGMTINEAMAYAKEIIVNGGASNSGLTEILNEYIHEDQVRSSSLEYGLVTVELPSFAPRHLYKEDIPEGKLIDYILASASCFPAVKSQEIDGVHYVDGGYYDNIPVSMALEKEADRIIAVDLQAIGYIRKEDLEDARNLTLIKSSWDLGNFLVFDKDNSKRIMRLGYLDAMKALGAFDGFQFTFLKKEFRHKELKKADAAAKIFGLDPLVVYSQETLNSTLTERLTDLHHDITLDKEALKDKKARLEALEQIVQMFSPEHVSLYIAEQLKESPKKIRIFQSLSSSKILPHEIQAAEYLVKNNLLPLQS